MPMAASSRTNPVRCNDSTSTTVSSPTAAAKKIRNGDVVLCTAKNPITIPSRIEWLIASLIIAMRRSTRKTPGSAQAAAVTAAMS